MLEVEILEEDKDVKVKLKGPINEESGKVLSDLYDKPNKTIIFDFSKVDYVNSLEFEVGLTF